MLLFVKKELFLLQGLLLMLFGQILLGQTDFSDKWEDFYSYNNVKDFIKINHIIYAIADNAAFVYNIEMEEINKISSVHGLSGKETTSIFYSENTKKFIIGYQSGLIEVIDERGKITIANDIERLDITGQKQINHISEFENNLYLSTPFGIVQYDIKNLNFGDTYYIGDNSSAVFVNQTVIIDEIIYAATENGIYTADLRNPNLIDFNNWYHSQNGNFKAITAFNTKVYTARDKVLYEVSDSNLQPIRSFSQTVIDLKDTSAYLTVSTLNKAIVLNSSLNQIFVANPKNNYNFSLHTAFAEEEQVYMATTAFGILQTDFSSSPYKEIHPVGPTSNQVFSITAQNNNLWVVYGGYNVSFVPMGKHFGFSHFNSNLEEKEQWVNIKYNGNYPAKDLVHVTIDPTMENKAYISSFAQSDVPPFKDAGGMLVVENNEITTFLNDTNSGLEDLAPNNPNYKSIRINGTSFDNQSNLWVTNSLVPDGLKKMNTNGAWTSFDLSSIMINLNQGELTELEIDRAGSVWIGSRRNGVLVFNETGNRKKALITEVTKGSLPDVFVQTLAIDRNNRIWIGTQKGLVVFSDAEGIFDASIYDAAPVIIEDDGVPKKLLGEQPINSIAIDGAENKWFGTDTGGVLGTTPSGEETLFNFNKDNSPLPSNRILKIRVDNSNGKVFFATDKGIVAFNNNVAPFGDELGEVYAYPNPVKKEHEFVTIDGRNGTHLPRGTNVKILDTAGRLVHETNVEIGQEIKGGKVIWDKTNLAGRKVASGVYIVLLTSPDKSETSSTKIAIIN